ncbi:MAG: mechanosensitive ion channel family protein [Bacteroidota bacterium]
MDLASLWSDFLALVTEQVNAEFLLRLLKAVLKLAAGVILGLLGSRVLVRLLSTGSLAHRAVLIRRIAFYTIFGLFFAQALKGLGFDLSLLLGAAGILTVALGFASQTSASNVISGLFLLGERPFAIGDVIRVGPLTGEVLSIDLLSAKLRTFDNLFVRVPNETLIKSEIVNLSRFPIRRVDVMVGVAYKEDVDHVTEVLHAVAASTPLCLQEPEPVVIFQGYGESALNLQFSVWAARENWLTLKTSIHVGIKAAFDEAGIEIPFPHRTLYTGATTEPLPVRVVDSNSPGDAREV